MQDYKKIRALRKALDKTLIEVSIATDVSFSVLNCLERGLKLGILNSKKRNAVNEWIGWAEKEIQKQNPGKKNGQVHTA